MKPNAIIRCIRETMDAMTPAQLAEKLRDAEASVFGLELLLDAARMEAADVRLQLDRVARNYERSVSHLDAIARAADEAMKHNFRPDTELAEETFAKLMRAIQVARTKEAEAAVAPSGAEISCDVPEPGTVLEEKPERVVCWYPGCPGEGRLEMKDASKVTCPECLSAIDRARPKVHG